MNFNFKKEMKDLLIIVVALISMPILIYLFLGYVDWILQDPFNLITNLKH
jgi:hypothetical protein